MRLWDRLLELEGCLAVTFRHVRGHRPKKDTSDDAPLRPRGDALAGPWLRCRRTWRAGSRICRTWGRMRILSTLELDYFDLLLGRI